VVVAWLAVKFWRVVEPLNKALVKEAKIEVREPMMPVLALKSVVEALPDTKRLVVVASVASKEVTVVEARVDEAVERKPFWKERVVEVAFSPVPSLVNG
jgi:hypothetical protein